MKSKQLLVILSFGLFLGFQSCEEEEDPKTTVIEKIVENPRHAIAINFKNKANGIDLVLNTTDKPYQNKLGQAFNVSRLRYLISDISFHQSDGSSFTLNEYHLIDASDNASLTFSPSAKVPAGDYNAISFNFGFDREDNMQQYPDLNTALWQWPMMLGGGYHFMQFEGKFDSSGVEGGFATHMGTARNLTATDTTFEDNHFEVYFSNYSYSIPAKSNFEISMNLEQWYENPYNWDFRIYNMPIMPNYAAQRKLNLNGPSVFGIN